MAWLQSGLQPKVSPTACLCVYIGNTADLRYIAASLPAAMLSIGITCPFFSRILSRALYPFLTRKPTWRKNVYYDIRATR